MNLTPGLSPYAYPLKTLGDAIYLSNDLIARMEEAAVDTDPARRRRLLNMVVMLNRRSLIPQSSALTGRTAT
jgi:NADH dehydrogenase FAD-containing subunit